MTTRTVDACKFMEKLCGPLLFSTVLTSTRLCEEMSQRKFAKSIGISPGYLRDIEHRRRFVNPAKAAEFALVLGYSPHQWAALAAEEWLQGHGISAKVRVNSIDG